MRKFILSLLLAVAAATASAEMVPFELNMDRVDISSAKPLGFSDTYFIPTVNLSISVAGDVWAQSKAGGSNAQARGRYVVKGADKAVVQDLARKVQDDLVTKMRAAGYTVLTYADLKDDPEIAKHDRNKPADDYGMPTNTAGNIDYVIASPSDEQSLDKPITGQVFWLKGLAKERKLTVIVPEITFEVPIMYGATEAGYKRDSASINVVPSMRMNGAWIWLMDGKQRAANILIQQHGKRMAADVAGTVAMVDEDQTEFNTAWKRSSSKWVMNLDPVAFSDGVLRVGYAINNMIVAQAKKAH